MNDQTDERALCVRSPLVPRLLEALGAALVAVLLGACGGGGGAPAPLEPDTVVDGLSGTVMLPDFDLGRTIEQEPNDVAAQAFDLAPLWPRSTVEVTGTLGTTPALYGRSDFADHLRLQSCVDQRLTLELSFRPDDPIGGAGNEVAASVVDVESGVELMSASGASQPLTLFFDATAYVAYDLVVSITAGHAWYVARLVGSDLPAAPAALVLTAPGGAQRGPALSAVPDAPSEAAAGRAPARCAGGHLLVRFEAGCDPVAVCEAEGLRLGRQTATGSYLVLFDCPAGQTGEARALSLGETLGRHADVRWAEPDWVVTAQGLPTDPLFSRQWHLPMVGAPSAWDVVTGDASVIVGVLDSGVIDHPDLEGQVVGGYDFISDPARAADGDGRDPDPTDMGDRFDGSGLSVWHGTHVAALVAAKQGNGIGGSGMAPGVRLLILRALGVGGGLVSDAIDAILYAAALYRTADGRELQTPLQILNLSVGLAQDAPDLRDACARAANNGVLLVGAVGNTGGGVLYPAAYPSVLAVAAVDGAMATTAYSNYGPEVDIAAPGGGVASDDWNDGWTDGILSATRDETVEPATYSYGYIVGTSQAAPQVAGAAALLLSIDPSLNALQLKSMLRGTALDLGSPGPDIAYGAGLLQVHEAVKAALEGLGTPRTDDPYLLLPTQSCQFEDFAAIRTRREIPLYNGGGGRLNILTAVASTDDGAPWLSASLTASLSPGAPVNQRDVVITINRNVMGATEPGRYAGNILLGNVGQVLGTIRVVMYVDEQTRAGKDLSVIALENATGIARRKALATADRGYRYWFRGLPDGDYTLQAGEDLDGNGFLCESFEACGYFGGPTRDDALPVPFQEQEPAVKGLSIDLRPQ